MSEAIVTQPSETPENNPAPAAASPTPHIYVHYDANNPPDPALDCFGKHYTPGGRACDGDPAIPGWENPCLNRAECKVRTESKQAAAAKAAAGEAPRKARETLAPKLTPAEIVAKGVVEGMTPSVNVEKGAEVGAVWKCKGKDVVYCNPSSRGFTMYSLQAFTEGKLKSGWHTGTVETIERVIEIVSAYDQKA